MSIDRESIKDRLRPGTTEPDEGYIYDTDFFGVIDDLADAIDGVADGSLLGPDSVTQGNLAPNSVGASEIKADAVGHEEIASDSARPRHSGLTTKGDIAVAAGPDSLTRLPAPAADDTYVGDPSTPTGYRAVPNAASGNLLRRNIASATTHLGNTEGFSSTSNTATLSSDQVTAYAPGERSLRAVANTSGAVTVHMANVGGSLSAPSGISQANGFVPVTPGEVVHAEFRFNHSDASAVWVLRTYFYTSAGAVVSNPQTATISGAQTWALQSLDVVVPAGAAWMFVSAFRSSGQSGAQTNFSRIGLWRGAGGTWRPTGTDIDDANTRVKPDDPSVVQMYNPAAPGFFDLVAGTDPRLAKADVSIPNTLIDAKGDLLLGSGDNTVARLAVGANGTVPYADSSQTTGARWKQLDSLDVRPVRTTFANVDFTITAAMRIVEQTGTLTAPRTVTLPPANAVPAGTAITVTDDSGTVTGANTITVTRAGSDTINGATSLVIANAWGARTFISDGTNSWSSGLVTASVTTGTVAGTVAAGDDPRIVNAVQTSALGNLLPASIATASSTTGTVLSSGSTVSVSSAQAETDSGPDSWLFTGGSTTPWIMYGGNTSSPNSSAIPVIGGQWYSLLWSVYAVGHTRATRALIYAWDSSGTLVANGTIVGANLASVSNTWQRRCATFQVPSTANRVAFYLGGVSFAVGEQMHIDRMSVLQDAVGSEAWALPTVPVWRRGVRRDPTNPAQVQVWVTNNTWVTV